MYIYNGAGAENQTHCTQYLPMKKLIAIGVSQCQQSNAWSSYFDLSLTKLTIQSLKQSQILSDRNNYSHSCIEHNNSVGAFICKYKRKQYREHIKCLMLTSVLHVCLLAITRKYCCRQAPHNGAGAGARAQNRRVPYCLQNILKASFYTAYQLSTAFDSRGTPSPVRII